jgi:periplasmic divalent cation tolerance protein
MSTTPKLPPDAVVCLVTAPQPNAREIARAIVERELAACVNVVPLVQSIYRWEGKIQADDEALLVVKTTHAAVSKLEALLDTLHPYETFELLALEVVAGAQGYLGWIGDSVARA